MARAAERLMYQPPPICRPASLRGYTGGAPNIWAVSLRSRGADGERDGTRAPDTRGIAAYTACERKPRGGRSLPIRACTGLPSGSGVVRGLNPQWNGSWETLGSR